MTQLARAIAFTIITVFPTISLSAQLQPLDTIRVHNSDDPAGPYIIQRCIGLMKLIAIHSQKSGQTKVHDMYDAKGRIIWQYAVDQTAKKSQLSNESVLSNVEASIRDYIDVMAETFRNTGTNYGNVMKSDISFCVDLERGISSFNKRAQ